MKNLILFSQKKINQLINKLNPNNKKLTLKTLLEIKNWKPKTSRNGSNIDISLPLIPFAAGIIFVLLVMGWSLWSLYVPQREVKKLSETQQKMMQHLSEIVELPKEAPTIAVVSEKEKLDQPFFEKSENGDQVIVFEKEGKVILYRPSTKKIINFANIELPESGGFVQEFQK